jgi:hypothetical protein
MSLKYDLGPASKMLPELLYGLMGELLIVSGVLKDDE